MVSFQKTLLWAGLSLAALFGAVTDGFAYTAASGIAGSLPSESAVIGSSTGTFAPKTAFESVLTTDVDTYEVLPCDAIGDYVAGTCGDGYYVITSWSVRSGSVGGQVQLKVYEVTRSGSEATTAVTVTEESDVETAGTNGVQTFDARIPVVYTRINQRYIGLYVPGTGPAVYYDASYDPATLTPGSSVFASADVGAEQSVGSVLPGKIPNIQAVVETDIDHDGYGDITQDSDVSAIAEPSPSTTTTPTTTSGGTSSGGNSSSSEPTTSTSASLESLKLSKKSLKTILKAGYITFKVDTEGGNLTASSTSITAVQGKKAKVVARGKSFTVIDNSTIQVKLSSAGKRWLKKAAAKTTRTKLKIKVLLKTDTTTQTYTNTYKLSK